MKVTHFDNIKEEKVEMDGAVEAYVRWMITDRDGAPNFAMRMFRLERGGETPYHKHPYEHESFILSGEGKLVFEGKEYAFSQWDVLYIDPDKMHQFVNTGNKELIFLCLIPYKK